MTRLDAPRSLPEQNQTLGTTRYALLPALCAALITGILGVLIWRRGVLMTADSWAYWQGAVSLLDGHGYRFFFGGLPITDWPPGYSLYLAAWQAALGVSGRTLAVANIALGVVSAFGWSWGLLRLLEKVLVGARAPRPIITGAVVFYVTVVVAYSCTYVLADNLKYALLPWFLYAVVMAALATDRAVFLRRSAAAGLLGTLLMVVHNGSAAFVVAACVVLLFGRVPLAWRLGGGVIVGVLSLVPWRLLTQALGQTASHAIGWGMGNTTPLHYINQAAAGIGELMASRPLLGCLLFLVPVGLILGTLYRKNTAEADGSRLSRRESSQPTGAVSADGSRLSRRTSRGRSLCLVRRGRSRDALSCLQYHLDTGPDRLAAREALSRLPGSPAGSCCPRLCRPSPSCLGLCPARRYSDFAAAVPCDQ